MLGGDEPPEPKQRRPWWFRPAVTAGVLVLVAGVGAVLTHAGHSSPGVQALPSSSASALPSGAPVSGGPIPIQTGAVDPGAGSRVVNGVPVGYPQTQNGAVAAAVNYELARSTATYFSDTATRHGILKAITTSGALSQELTSEDSAVQQFDTSIGLNSSNASSFVARASALGTKVDNYSPTVATVEVWVCGLVGITSSSSPLPVSASWDTYTLTLQWQDGDWKLSAISAAAGPTPLEQSDNTPSSVSDFALANKEFHAPPYVG